jgi:hypothetical protein
MLKFRYRNLDFSIAVGYLKYAPFVRIKYDTWLWCHGDRERYLFIDEDYLCTSPEVRFRVSPEELLSKEWSVEIIPNYLYRILEIDYSILVYLRVVRAAWLIKTNIATELEFHQEVPLMQITDDRYLYDHLNNRRAILTTTDMQADDWLILFPFITDYKFEARSSTCKQILEPEWFAERGCCDDTNNEN